MPNSPAHILLLCPLVLLYFCSIPELRVAGGQNAARLILCLRTPALCLCTQIVCLAWELWWSFGSCCLLIKGVSLLMELPCTGKCAHTPRSTCTVSAQAVVGLLHICCKHLLTTCSKPKCAELIHVCTGASPWGFLGVHLVKIFILHLDKMLWKRSTES